MTELQTKMLITVLTNYDVLPETVSYQDERVPVSSLLYRAKRQDLQALYTLNNEVLGRRGRLLRSKLNKDIH